MGLIAAAAPGVVFATPQPAAFIVYNFSAVVNDYKAGSFTGADFSADLTTQPSLSVVTTASSDILSLYEQQYIGYVLVWGEVVGSPSSTIPIDVNYFDSDSTHITPGGYADAASQFVFYDGVDPAVDVGEISIIGYNSGSKSEGGTYAMNVQTDTPFYVALTSTDTLYAPFYTYGVGESASSFLDPMIYIDPSFAGSNPGYSLEISSGIQNVGPSSAPEPAAWALILAGFGGLGGMMRVDRRKPSARGAVTALSLT